MTWKDDILVLFIWSAFAYLFMRYMRKWNETSTRPDQGRQTEEGETR